MTSLDATAEKRPLMVVDDDAIRETIEAIVEAHGYRVVTATDGKDALDLLRSGMQPGVILLDLRMPVMDGRAFRERQMSEPQLSRIPVVILSGDLDACRAAEQSGTSCLVKPIDLERLLSVTKRFCGRPSSLE